MTIIVMNEKPQTTWLLFYFTSLEDLADKYIQI